MCSGSGYSLFGGNIRLSQVMVSSTPSGWPFALLRTNCVSGSLSMFPSAASRLMRNGCPSGIVLSASLPSCSLWQYCINSSRIWSMVVVGNGDDAFVSPGLTNCVLCNCLTILTRSFPILFFLSMCCMRVSRIFVCNLWWRCFGLWRPGSHLPPPVMMGLVLPL